MATTQLLAAPEGLSALFPASSYNSRYPNTGGPFRYPSRLVLPVVARAGQ